MTFRTSVKLSWEAASAAEGAVQIFSSVIQEKLMKKAPLDGVFNVDEVGLFVIRDRQGPTFQVRKHDPKC